MSKPIRIGNVFNISYTFYEPSAANSKLPDYTAPIDFTGYSVKFCVVNRGTVTKYDAVLETIPDHSELCKVSVSLTVAQTSALKETITAKRDTSYLEFTSGSTVFTRAQQKLQIIEQGDR